MLSKFSDREIELLKAGKVPPTLTWHHHQHPGILYDENGESVPSQFFIDFNIDMDETDEDTIEQAVYKYSSSQISILLDGCSYEEIIIPKIQESINLKKSYNAVILIYNFEYKNEISSTGNFDFIAAANYE